MTYLFMIQIIHISTQQYFVNPLKEVLFQSTQRVCRISINEKLLGVSFAVIKNYVQPKKNFKFIRHEITVSTQ